MGRRRKFSRLVEFPYFKEVEFSLIIKSREYPVEIKLLEVILRRGKIDEEKREKIYSEIRKREAGYQGEKRLDYFLSLSIHGNLYLLNNLRLKNGEHAFEIDTVIVTSYFILLIDAKNYSGSLFFDQKLKECIRTYKDQVDSILDPLSQSYLHNYQMKNFWKRNKLVTLPILSLVIITHPSTTILTNPGLEKELNKRVIHADHLLERLGELFKVYPNRRLSDKQARDIAQKLFESHTPRELKILERFHLHHSDILSGVQCPSCSAFQMQWKTAKWWCPHCRTTSKNAHEQAIYEYLLLYKSISTSECQHFLGIQSKITTKRLLDSLGLKKVGTTFAQRYELPDNYP
jgi:hypothetical protein